MKVVIVGGVAGGAGAAARLRRLDESAEIVMIERTGYISYANCGLPYYIGGSIQDKGKLTLQTPESFRARFDIDVRVSQEVVAIDRAAKRVKVKRLDDGEVYEEAYDKLVLSPGARPAIPSIAGADGPRVFTLRTVEDTFAIKGFVDGSDVKRAAVIGAGFIGLEMAENLREAGLEVSLVQRGEHALGTLDGDMAALLHNRLREAGVDLLLSRDVCELRETDEAAGVEVRFAGGEEPLAVDMVVMSIGVEPESTLAREAGLELGVRGSIKVDERLRTSDPDIYALGDAIQVNEFVSADPALISLAGPANKQGRIVADNLCGRDHVYDGVLGTSVLKLFDLTAASTGLTSRQAERAGIDFDSVVICPPHHATYYPGAQVITLKVLFERPTGRIIGAQAVGREGVEKRIDVIACAIRAHMDAADLAELDLAYAPPFSSAKDPVNVAGFVIGNVLDGLVEQVHWGELNCVHGDRGVSCDASSEEFDVVMLDARSAGEYARGHVAGALNVPLNDLRGVLDSLAEDPASDAVLSSEARILSDARARNAMLYVYCQTGLRSYVACRMLSQHGFACRNVAGGYGYYLPVARDAAAKGRSVGPCGLEV